MLNKKMNYSILTTSHVDLLLLCRHCTTLRCSAINLICLHSYTHRGLGYHTHALACPPSSSLPSFSVLASMPLPSSSLLAAHHVHPLRSSTQ